MRKVAAVLASFLLFFSLVGGVRAVEDTPEPEVATEAAEATKSATASGIVEKVVEKKPDLT